MMENQHKQILHGLIDLVIDFSWQSYRFRDKQQFTEFDLYFTVQHLKSIANILSMNFLR